MLWHCQDILAIFIMLIYTILMIENTWSRAVFRTKLSYIKKEEILNCKDFAEMLNVAPTTLMRFLNESEVWTPSFVIQRKIKAFIEDWEAEHGPIE